MNSLVMVDTPPKIEIEFVNGHYWFEDNVLFIRPKLYERNYENVKLGFDFVKDLIGKKRVCVVFLADNNKPLDPKTRTYASEEFPKMFKAMAIVSSSSVIRVMANLVFSFVKQDVPKKVFVNDRDAFMWVKHYQ